MLGTGVRWTDPHGGDDGTRIGLSAVGDIVVASSFSWLDYSTRDREKALEVIDLFKEPGTLDELGIGTVRDALSDRLFPGISTIQTQAKYFLFVPWIYLRLERRRIGSRNIAQEVPQEEAFRTILRHLPHGEVVLWLSRIRINLTPH